METCSHRLILLPAVCDGEQRSVYAFFPRCPPHVNSSWAATSSKHHTTSVIYIYITHQLMPCFQHCHKLWHLLFGSTESPWVSSHQDHVKILPTLTLFQNCIYLPYCISQFSCLLLTLYLDCNTSSMSTTCSNYKKQCKGKEYIGSVHNNSKVLYQVKY
jgi:hypothetical protein